MSREALGEPSDCDIRVLRAVAQHGTIGGAARELFLSPHTVDWHLDCLRRMSGFRHLPQLVAWGAQRGWLEHLPLVSARAARTG